jgi:hypothetical protein
LPHRRTSYSIQRRETARIVSQATVQDPDVRDRVNILINGRIAQILQIDLVLRAKAVEHALKELEKKGR